MPRETIEHPDVGTIVIDTPPEGGRAPKGQPGIGVIVSDRPNSITVEVPSDTVIHEKGQK